MGGEKKYSPPRDRMKAGIDTSAEGSRTFIPSVTRGAPLPACPMMGSIPGEMDWPDVVNLLKIKLWVKVRQTYISAANFCSAYPGLLAQLICWNRNPLVRLLWYPTKASPRSI